MITLQEYKTKKAEQTALSDVDFRKAQLIARNPRETTPNEVINEINPVSEDGLYLIAGEPYQSTYDVKPLDMLSRQLNNESIEATNEYNPIFRDTNVSEGNRREISYKTKYWFGKYTPVPIIGSIEPEKPKKIWEMDSSIITYLKNDLSEPFFFDSLKKIPYTAPQDDSYLRMQLTLAQMNALDKKLSQYAVDNTCENMWLLIQKYQTANLPVASIQTPEGLELALTAIETQKPEVKIDFEYIKKLSRSRPSRLDGLCFKPTLGDKVINSFSSYRDRDDEFDEFGFRRPETIPLKRDYYSARDYDTKPKENIEKFLITSDDNKWRN